MPDRVCTGAKALTVDEFRGDEVSSTSFVDAVDREDVRVIERGCRSRLLLKAAQAIVVLRLLGRKELERNLATERGVVREIDLAHTAGAKLRTIR